MRLTTTQSDRAAGVLLGQAVGDALGVPYELGAARFDETTGPQMSGGGLGGYAPGQWSDDTEMATCIARVGATGQSLTLPASLDQVGAGFLGWLADGPADIGVQTASVLRGTRRAARAAGAPGPDGLADLMRSTSRELHERTGLTAGNGALMRTSIVGLTSLGDREATRDAATALAGLTHWDPLAADSCVLWSEAVRRAVVDGVLDVRSGLDLIEPDRREQWTGWLNDAEAHDPATFTGNGFTVVALQAAWSAIHHTRAASEGPEHVPAALHRAIAIGHDTDTVAAIAGGLLGARYGASALPFVWTRQVHGWPGMRATDLTRLALLTARGGAPDSQGWPGVARLNTGWERQLAVPHPSDEGVLLGTTADLRRAADLDVHGIVSLCRLGEEEFAPPGVDPRDHAVVWLVDTDEPAAHQHLRWTLDEAARAVAVLRSEGKRVLVHCVAAQHRTPAVALRYAVLRGASVEAAAAEITSALGWEQISGLLWQEARHG